MSRLRLIGDLISCRRCRQSSGHRWVSAMGTFSVRRRKRPSESCPIRVGVVRASAVLTDQMPPKPKGREVQTSPFCGRCLEALKPTATDQQDRHTRPVELMQRELTLNWLPCARSTERTAARQPRMPVTGLPGLQIIDGNTFFGGHIVLCLTPPKSNRRHRHYHYGSQTIRRNELPN
jgi:hypothetical protein